jgi:hypothetical protein
LDLLHVAPTRSDPHPRNSKDDWLAAEPISIRNCRATLPPALQTRSHSSRRHTRKECCGVQKLDARPRNPRFAGRTLILDPQGQNSVPPANLDFLRGDPSFGTPHVRRNRIGERCAYRRLQESANVADDLPPSVTLADFGGVNLSRVNSRKPLEVQRATR